MRTPTYILVICFVGLGLALNAEARRENPFTPQLPVPVEAKPADQRPDQPPKQPDQPKQPDKVDKPVQTTRVFLPPPPAPEVTQQTEPVAIRPPNLVVKGVIWNSDRPQAIINEQVVDIGGKISNATITDIQKDYIKFEFRGTEFQTNL